MIDNYSRRILSWTLEERLGSGGTCRILRESVLQLKNCPEHAIVIADSGIENVNEAVDDLLDGEDLTRVLAQIEITFSNSMIETFWRSLKHSWLYLHSLRFGDLGQTPITKDSGWPSSVVPLRMLHAISASASCDWG